MGGIPQIRFRVTGVLYGKTTDKQELIDAGAVAIRYVEDLPRFLALRNYYIRTKTLSPRCELPPILGHEK